MTNNMPPIVPEPDGRCEMCSKTAPLRPYGPNAAMVCFECGMKDEDNARKMFLRRRRGDA